MSLCLGSVSFLANCVTPVCCAPKNSDVPVILGSCLGPQAHPFILTLSLKNQSLLLGSMDAGPISLQSALGLGGLEGSCPSCPLSQRHPSSPKAATDPPEHPLNPDTFVGVLPLCVCVCVTGESPVPELVMSMSLSLRKMIPEMPLIYPSGTENM